jgi:hypothetical protein
MVIRTYTLVFFLTLFTASVNAESPPGQNPSPEAEQPGNEQLREEADELARLLAKGVHGFAELMRRDAERLDDHAQEWSELGEQLIEETQRLLERAFPPPPTRPTPQPDGQIEV